MMNNIYLAHELLEWFDCPLKTFYLHQSGCNNLQLASQIREQIRAIDSFVKYKQSMVPNAFNVEADDISEAHEQTLEKIKGARTPKILNATLMHQNVVVFLPFMQWNKSLQSWQIFIPVVGHGVKQGALQLASLILMMCKTHDIAVAKILFSYYHPKTSSTDHYWVDSDTTVKVHSYFEKEQKNLNALLSFISTPEASNVENWPPCNKQYCVQCATVQHYEIDDVRTLRKAKFFIEELEKTGIKKISDIPDNIVPEDHVIMRQVESVSSNTALFIKDEVSDFIDTLEFPRYYLDFEAFSTSIPYDYPPPYIAKVWGYTPFLFSLQWQDAPNEKIHTQLWSMIPGKNQLVKMWDTLKSMLQKANSIIVYGSQFEHDMILQLAGACSDDAIGSSILEKIIDLQTLFFNLSLYHPTQKGKISLKTIAPIWIQGDYERYKVNEGIAANYYFTALTDDKLSLFDTIKSIPYVSHLLAHIAKAENDSVKLQDIADYCKYDTEVMIRIVAKLEKNLNA